MNISLDTPIFLKHTNNYLLTDVEGTCRCSNEQIGSVELMVLVQTTDNKIIIKSQWNGKNMHVTESGVCCFANHNEELTEKFDVEIGEDGKFFFINCHTGNVMRCDLDGVVRCLYKNRGEEEAWTVVRCLYKNRGEEEAWTVISPDTPKTMTSTRLRLVSLAAIGALSPLVLGLSAGAMVPVAMSTFGTVVAGVGTFHAPLAAGGCAAILQVTSAALVSETAVVLGGVAGAIASVSKK